MTDRVRLCLRGRMAEKFIGRALKEGIRFQRVERSGAREMMLSATERDAERLMELAGQLGIELTVVGEAGLPLVRKRFLQRLTLPVAPLLSLLLIVSFTARIWRVEAVSVDGAADQAMLMSICESAAEFGARPGRLRSDIDRDDLAMRLHERWPELTHVSVRARGVFLSIEIATEEKAPEVYEIDQARDLVALRDAVVVYVEPLTGKACVKAGDTVRQGQTLIRGEERIDTDVMRAVRAQGSVIGRVWFTAEQEARTEETIVRRTGNRRFSAWLRLGEWSWTLTDAEEYACCEQETEYLPIGGLYLPLRIERTVYWETEETLVSKDRALLEAETGAAALADARGQIPGDAAETAHWIDFEERNGILAARAIVQAEMNIAAGRTELAD